MNAVNASPLLTEARRLLETAESEDRDLESAEEEVVGALLDAAEALGRVAKLRSRLGVEFIKCEVGS